MRINIIHMGFLYSGGGERVVIEQALRLRKRGHTVKVFSPIIYPERSYPDLLKQVAPERLVPHLPLPFPFRQGSALLASAILPFGTRKMADCDILLCQSQPSMWIGLRLNKLFGIPYVGYLHQPTTFIYPRPQTAGNWDSGDFMVLDALLGKAGRPTAKVLDRVCHANASALLFNSEWTKEQFRQNYGLNGLVCYPGIASPRHFFISPQRKNRIVTAARHVQWKRIDLAFKILDLINSKSKPRLLVVGKHTEHTPFLQKMASGSASANRIEFTGFLDEPTLASTYAEASAYIQTSINEPFGLAPLEAESYGVPAVVWGDAGVKETVLDGETGFYAKPYDLLDFASKLDTIFSDPIAWWKMSKEAQLWAQKFSWDVHMDTLEETLAVNAK